MKPRHLIDGRTLDQMSAQEIADLLEEVRLELYSQRFTSSTLKQRDTLHWCGSHLFNIVNELPKAGLPDPGVSHEG